MKKLVRAVVIGASAGGVEALNRLFAALPAPPPVPVLVALHIAPQGSIIVGAFRRVAEGTRIKEAEDKETLRPGAIYFAPPNYHLLVEKDLSVSLSVDEPVHFARPSIDVLFESAAEACGENLLGVLLTGANDDGAAGLLAIHRAGGLTVVQDPATAQSPEMPTAALKAFQPAFIAGLDEIGRKLARLEPAGEGAAYA
jgi:two-component system chemotaxis response regulator CheB